MAERRQRPTSVDDLVFRALARLHKAYAKALEHAKEFSFTFDAEEIVDALDLLRTFIRRRTILLRSVELAKSQLRNVGYAIPRDWEHLCLCGIPSRSDTKIDGETMIRISVQPADSDKIQAAIIEIERELHRCGEEAIRKASGPIYRTVSHRIEVGTFPISPIERLRLTTSDGGQPPDSNSKIGSALQSQINGMSGSGRAERPAEIGAMANSVATPRNGRRATTNDKKSDSSAAEFSAVADELTKLERKLLAAFIDKPIISLDALHKKCWKEPVSNAAIQRALQRFDTHLAQLGSPFRISIKAGVATMKRKRRVK
jgi:hypothetical protein